MMRRQLSSRFPLASVPFGNATFVVSTNTSSSLRVFTSVDGLTCPYSPSLADVFVTSPLLLFSCL